MKSKIHLVLRIAISAGIIAYLLAKVDTAKLPETLRSGNLVLFGVAYALIWLTHVAQVVRWHYLMVLQACDMSSRDYVLLLLRRRTCDVRFGQLFRYHLIGNFFQLFLPSSASGDVVKGYFSVRHGRLGVSSVASLLVGRLLGVACVIIMAVCSLAAVRDPHVRMVVLRNPVVWLAMSSPAIIALLMWRGSSLIKAFPHPPLWLPVSSVISLCAQTIAALRSYGKHRAPLLGGFAVSVAIYGLMVFTSYLVFAGLGWRTDMALFAVYVPLVHLLTSLPVSFNGIGFREALFTYFFSEFGCTSEHVIGYAVVGYSMLLSVGLIGAVCYLVDRRARGMVGEA